MVVFSRVHLIKYLSKNLPFFIWSSFWPHISTVSDLWKALTVSIYILLFRVRIQHTPPRAVEYIYIYCVVSPLSYSYSLENTHILLLLLLLGRKARRRDAKRRISFSVDIYIFRWVVCNPIERFNDDDPRRGRAKKQSFAV